MSLLFQHLKCVFLWDFSTVFFAKKEQAPYFSPKSPFFIPLEMERTGVWRLKHNKK